MGGWNINKKRCFACQHYFYKNELKHGKGKKNYCLKCMANEQNRSLPQNELIEQTYKNILQNMGEVI